MLNENWTGFVLKKAKKKNITAPTKHMQFLNIHAGGLMHIYEIIAAFKN